MKSNKKEKLTGQWQKAYKQAMRKSDSTLGVIGREELDDYDLYFNRYLRNEILKLLKSNRAPLPDIIAELIDKAHYDCQINFKQTIKGRLDFRSLLNSIAACMIDYMDFEENIIVFAVIMTERLSSEEITWLTKNVGGAYLQDSECIELHIWKLEQNDLFHLQNCLDTAQDILYRKTQEISKCA